MILLTAVPLPRTAAPGAPPRILYVHLSSNRVHIGDEWSGRIVTTTNVASVVLSTPFFAFEVPRTTFGEFSFSTKVLAVPSLYRRAFEGRITAYNAAGSASSVPIAVDFR